MNTILILFGWVLLLILFYVAVFFIILGIRNRTNNDEWEYEPPIIYRINNENVMSNAMTKSRCEYLLKRKIHFTLWYTDGIDDWKVYGHNVMPEEI